ncbi:adenylyltransferase/cytidyltransferase family protein (plasmid) [Deinococcus sp. KNUC1210]|uniref:adenylyltransferase/cytidyltransferase family protein n=1 Tax=Deinococcus sp. KNUC1210 TaxID=2917691 RepID=UPI001EF0C271|nr:adenylyltransferase/cytidyltransferase family protein [Deinococcus sp. KNUC1210]ULH17697.1 adenylyltransferase/cytidyltransferase family protein [Deinococcus sp. KNUC1210]
MCAASPQTAVLIGRFQPPHLAHLALMQQALTQAPELVVVLGSAHHARTPKNPLSDSERAQLIREMLKESGTDPARLRTVEVPDFFYNLPMWVEQVRRAVGPRRAVLCGFEKDASSFYLKLFPEWQLGPAPEEGGEAGQRLSSPAATPLFSGLSATTVREAMYRLDWESVSAAVPAAVAAALLDFSKTPEFTEPAAGPGSNVAARGGWPHPG